MVDNKDKLGEKIKAYFKDNWVNKSLSRQAGLNFLPKYVSEYIIGVFYQRTESEEEALTTAKKFVNDHYPDSHSSEYLKHQLIEKNTIEIIQKFKVNVNLNTEFYYANIPIIGERIWVDPTYVERYPALLTTGMWGKGTLTRDLQDDTDADVLLVDYMPFQVGSFDDEELFEGRAHCTLKEWIDILVTSIGLNPSNLNDEEKIMILMRFLPLIRRNLNIAEFGPKSTGKTYVFRHFSSYIHIISGSSVTPAKFIYDLAKRSPGLITSNDTVVFDEVTSAEFGSKKDYEMIGLLKDYMEGGHVSRGTYEASEDTSLVFIGNINVSKKQPRFRDYSRDLPFAFSDTAFLDRIHGVIPGWRIPKISQIEESLSDSAGLMSNYLGEMFHKMRRYDHPSMDWSLVTSNFGMVRNEKAVRTITEGLLALLFPGVSASSHDINFCLKLGCELRQNIYDQLTFLDPEEFPKLTLTAEIHQV